MTTTDVHKTPNQVATAVRDAALTALIAFGIFLPLVGFQTISNIRNELVLTTRWVLLFSLVAIIGLGRLCYALAIYPALQRRALKPTKTEVPAWRTAVGKRFVPFAIGFTIVYPFIVIATSGFGGALKWVDNFGIQILIYVMLGWGLNIVVGLAGLLDLGYVAFYAVGAYSYALLAKEFGFSFWILLPLAGCLASFWGVLLGFPVLRLRGDYLAIVTLAFGEIIRLILLNWQSLTGGPNGVTGIPRPTLFGIPLSAGDDGLAAMLGIEYSPTHRIVFLFYIILALALLTNWVTIRLRRLPIGRAWEALREDEVACRALGINTTTTKLTAFATGAMFGGFAGAFFATRQGFISPESFTFHESALVLAIVVLGGMGSQLGVALAALAMIGGFELFRGLDQYRMLVFGMAMVLLMIWRPRGLIGHRAPTVFLKHNQAISSDLVKEGHG